MELLGLAPEVMVVAAFLFFFNQFCELPQQPCKFLKSLNPHLALAKLRGVLTLATKRVLTNRLFARVTGNSESST